VEKNVVKAEKNVEIVEFTFGPDEIAEAENEIVRYVNKNYTIPGFRKGKAPKRIIETFFGENFRDMVLEELSRKIEDTLKDEELFIPAVIADRKIEGDVAVFVVELHREPKVELKDYTGLELSVPKQEEVLANYVDNKLEELRNEAAIVEPKDGPAEIGDVINIEYTIEKDGKIIADHKTQEILIVEDDDRPIVTNVIGKKKGDIVEFDRTFENSNNKYHYKIEIKEVLKRTLMELNDEFAKSVASEVNTLEELKKKLEEEGLEAFESWKKDFLRQQVQDKLAELVELEISEKTLDYFVNRAIENAKKENTYDSYLKQAGTEEKLYEEFKTGILNELKKNTAIEKIAEKEQIEVTDEEVMKTAEELSTYWGISPERAKEIVKTREDIRNDIVENIRRTKVQDLIVEKATIKEISVDEPVEEQKEEEEKEEAGSENSENKE